MLTRLNGLVVIVGFSCLDDLIGLVNLVKLDIAGHNGLIGHFSIVGQVGCFVGLIDLGNFGLVSHLGVGLIGYTGIGLNGISLVVVGLGFFGVDGLISFVGIGFFYINGLISVGFVGLVSSSLVPWPRLYWPPWPHRLHWPYHSRWSCWSFLLWPQWPHGISIIALSFGIIRI
jgi:hypothetical protein